MTLQVPRVETRSDGPPWQDLEALSFRLREAVAEVDEAAFPNEAFALLRGEGLLGRGMLAGRDVPMAGLLELIAAVGRGDLSTARIFEGHVNALQLLDRFAGHLPEAVAQAIDRGEALLAVWNTDAPGRTVRLRPGKPWALEGAKNFASGVDGVTHAIVTVETNGGRQMVLLPISRDADIDRSWWRPSGMKASGSHVIDLSGAPVSAGQIVGKADDYVRQPWFSAGAIRFAAAHVGGMHALLDGVRDHLGRTRRDADPYQRHRLAELAMAVEGGYAWLARAAQSWDRHCEQDSVGPDENEPAVAHANLTRCAVERLCMEAIALTQRAVGCAAFLEPHPLERPMRDLATYLRQPNPDGALAAAGEAVAAGTFRVGTGLDGTSERDLT